MDTSSISNGITIDTIKVFLRFIKKHLAILLILSFLTTLGAYAYASYFCEKEYTSSVKMYASVDYVSSDVASANSELSYTKSVLETYVNILKSRDFYDAVSSHLEGKISSYTIERSISIGSIDDTNLFLINVVTDSPEMSFAIANAVSTIASDYIKQIDSYSIINIVDDAYLPTGPSSPNVLFYAFAGLVLGGVLSLVISILSDLYDTRIKSEEDLKKKYKIPILSAIPDYSK